MTNQPRTHLEPVTTRMTFVDVILHDEELLQAEFEAIVAAQWSGLPPPDRVSVATTHEPPARALRHPEAPAPGGLGVTGGNLAVAVGSRQRSPPTGRVVDDASRPRPRTRPGPRPRPRMKR